MLYSWCGIAAVGLFYTCMELCWFGWMLLRASCIYDLLSGVLFSGVLVGKVVAVSVGVGGPMAHVLLYC